VLHVVVAKVFSSASAVRALFNASHLLY